MATDLERRSDGSPSPLKKEKEEDEDEEADAVLESQEHGREFAQLGQRMPRRWRRQEGQTPLRRFLEGCFGHFHTSSSSNKYGAICVSKCCVCVVDIYRECLAELGISDFWRLKLNAFDFTTEHFHLLKVAYTIWPNTMDWQKFLRRSSSSLPNGCHRPI